MHPDVSLEPRIYHKGVGEEDKTRGGMRSANQKRPRDNRGASENADRPRAQAEILACTMLAA